ncbi:hypothetical protein [Segetibacter aerophilus]|nr:hypothetical protein [Segetibacter aerophilus]
MAQRKMINGVLRDSTTLFPIAAGTITNSATGKTVKTDNVGFFKLEAGANDFIYASAKSYRFDTLKYSLMFTDTITIYLPFSGNVLPVVTVKGQYTRYQLDSIERKKAFEENRGTVLKTLSTDHPSGFGLTFNLDNVFKKKYRNQKGEERVFSILEKSAYVDYRFSPNLVAYYTGYKGEKLRTFMNLYSPSFEWLRQHPTNEDVLYYINDKLKIFKAKGSK